MRRVRPDVLQDKGLPSNPADVIPDEPPPNFFDKKVANVEGVGIPSAASFFTTSRVDPTDWYKL